MHVVNAVSCEPDDTFGRGAFHARVFELTDRLGASVIGATVYEMRAGEKLGPYHFHHGVEEWLYAVAGAPLLRDPAGEPALEPGALVAFSSGPTGAHTVHGPGRVVMFSAGDRGWGEAFVSVYPDSDKIAAAPGVMFRRADAIDTLLGDAGKAPAPWERPAPGSSSPAINLMTASLESPPGHGSPDGDGVGKATLGPRLGAQTWTATLYELAPGEAMAAYHYEWCREEWALVVSGAPTLRHAEGHTMLSAGDICCFPQGPTGAHRLRNDSKEPARLIVFSTSTDRPMSTFYPDEDTVLIYISDRERLLFRHDDRIEDYWDGEPGAT
ncbi:MAG: cupin domain-containing protein [Actinobacteria bacterium]|nr:cupin domain-containing protein [Actinomycetota bacterium]MCA1697720.1 cupin domain-containing protein [Actinomycetota bacterium]